VAVPPVTLASTVTAAARVPLISSTGMFGAEKVIMELLIELRAQKIETYFACLENQSKAHLAIIEEANKHTDNVHIFDCSGQFDIRTIWHIRSYLKKNKINIIHSHGYKANFYSLLAATANNIAIITTCHNWLSVNYKMKIYEWIDKKVLSKFNKIIVVSDEIEEKILNADILPAKVIKINNGIGIGKYRGQNKRRDIRAQLGIGEDTVVVGSVGRLDNNKGISQLLMAAKLLLHEFNNIVFLIVGDGPARQKLCDESENMGINDHVIFTGYSNDIPAILSAIDIFVLPSFIEGLPMVLLEAMAAGKPVIATRVGEIPRVLEHGKSGIIVEPGDIMQLKDAVKSLIKDNELLCSLAEYANERVEKEYSSKRMATHYVKEYEGVLNGVNS